MRKVLLVVSVLLAFTFNHHFVNSANILFLLPVASKSHVHVFEPLVRRLGEKGHEVTSLTPLASKGMPPSVKEIVILPVNEVLKDLKNPFEVRKQGKFAQFANASMDEIINPCNRILESAILHDLMKNSNFDLVIVDIMLNQCILGVVPQFKAPYIYVSTMVAPSYLLEPLGNRLPSSFIPSPFLDYGHKMTFMERVVNWTFNIMLDFMGHFFFVPALQKVYQEKLGINTTIYEIDSNVSMVFVNSHFSLTYPRPYLPDIVEIGGMHARKPLPLPKDLDDWISGAEHGCIFFSLGSIAKGSDMPEDTRQVFINVFSRLKQRVLWKYETETMEGLPKNVKLSKWLPQQDVLGHKNVVLFISHGGLLSITETIYHAVPIVGVPLFADQDLNIKQAVKAGFGLSLEILEMNEQTLEATLKEVLENKKYANRVKQLSQVWLDQQSSPLETAVFWTEYVIRHKGALHLRSAARELNVLQYYSLDVMAFVSAILISIVLIIKCTCLYTFRKICGESKQNRRDQSLENKKRK